MANQNMPKITESKGAVILNASTELKKMEIRFAASVAVHAPIICSDQMVEIFKMNVFTNSKCNNQLKGLSVHRTKCTALIKNVKMS